MNRKQIERPFEAQDGAKAAEKIRRERDVDKPDVIAGFLPDIAAVLLFFLLLWSAKVAYAETVLYLENNLLEYISFEIPAQIKNIFDKIR